MSATLADPDTRFPGLPDGTAYDVAAVVEARTAGLWVLVAHLRDGGCPDPHSPDLLAQLVARVEAECWWAEDWADELRDVVVGACEAVEDQIARVRRWTR
jgi:hypothetical protein